jgi:LysM repeat protein
VYVVRAGDTLADIAERFGVTPRRLVEANSLSGQLIYPGQVLRIPSSFASREQSRSAGTSLDIPCDPRATIVVRPGDTLAGLARRWDLTVQELKSHNGLASDRIWVGQALLIACQDGTDNSFSSVHLAPTPGAQPAACAGPYTVRPGDTLRRIAGRCGVSVASLKAANSLVSNVLMVGQALEIPPDPDAASVAPRSSGLAAGPAQSSQGSTAPDH